VNVVFPTEDNPTTQQRAGNVVVDNLTVFGFENSSSSLVEQRQALVCHCGKVSWEADQPRLQL